MLFNTYSWLKVNVTDAASSINGSSKTLNAQLWKAASSSSPEPVFVCARVCECVLGQWKLPLNHGVPLHAWPHYLEKTWELWSVENDLETTVEKQSERNWNST